MKEIQVTAAIIKRDGKILICQRHRNDHFPLRWEFPGGKIEPGETPEMGLKRELTEELGIDAVIGQFINKQTYFYREKNLKVNLNFFWVTEYTGSLTNKVFERMDWVSNDQIADYDFLEADRQIVRDLADGILC